MYATPRLLAMMNSFGSGFSSLSPEPVLSIYERFGTSRQHCSSVSRRAKEWVQSAAQIKVPTFQLPRLVGSGEWSSDVSTVFSDRQAKRLGRGAGASVDSRWIVLRSSLKVVAIYFL